tara:strand:- start:51 stop:929 length:879 start_codon:yes stop_codon:yes gene_type:complete
MNTIDLKYQIEIMYDLALQAKADMYIEHPVRLVQSVKSIIGINPDNPSKKLLSFCETYVGGFSKSIKYKDSDDKSLSEVVTFSDLELSLKNKNFNESIKNVSQLLKVSDSKHILEFFVEFSLKYNMQSFYCIWSVYKMMLFLRGKDILQNIIFCIDLIIADDDSIYVENNSDQIYNLASFKYDKNSIEQMWIYYSVINETLVRSENITKYIYNNSVEKFSKQTQSQTPNVLKEQKMLGREWISSYLENIDCKLLDVKLVLILEACRASLKASSGKYDEIIWDRLNIYLNEYR